MLFQISLGVDIQENGLYLACLKASSRNVKLVSHAAYPFGEGMDDGEKAAAMLELIEGFLRKNKISPTSVFLGIPRNTTVLRYLEFPIAVKENLRESLGYELAKHVPFSLEDVYFDFQVISEDKTAGRLHLLLVVVKKQMISPLLGLAKRLGAGISGIEISATALTNYFFRLDGKNDGLFKAFVHVSEHDIELGLFKDGLLFYSRAIPKDEDLPKVIPAAFERIHQDFGNSDEPINTVICGMEKDALLMEQLYGTNGINIQMADLARSQLPSINVITAYGLALKGVRKTSMGINLLPPLLRKKPSKLKVYTLFGLVSLVILGALAWGGGVFLQRQWTLDRLDVEIKSLVSQLKKIEQIKEKKERIEGRINYLNTLRQGGPPILDTIKELSERIPKNAWVNRFTFSKKGVEIEGEAASASQLIPLLEASPLFEDVAFLSAITKASSGKERFRIGLSLK